MTKDAAAVLNLLQTLNDWLPGPTTIRSNPLSYRAEPGKEAPSRKVECSACSGLGRYGKDRRRQCARCHGHGTLNVDAYTGLEMTTSSRHLRLMTTVELDTELVRLAQCVRIREGIEALDGFTASQDRKDQLYRQGSYQALEDALRTLEQRKPIAHSMILMFTIYHHPGIVSDRIQAILDASCELLAHWMPKPIRVPAWARQESSKPPKGHAANGHQRGQRNAEIRRLHEAGLSPRKIGIQVGLTKQRVCQILREEAA